MPVITAVYAGLLGVVALVLAALVVKNRRRARVGLGAGNDAGLERAIRVHANFVEYAPMVVILMILNELSGAQAWLLHACGSAFVLGRVWHAFGLSGHSGVSKGRFFGTLITWTVMLIMALSAVWLGASRTFIG